MATKTFAPGDSYFGWASTYSGGVQTDADALPVASLYHNGALDASVVLAVTKVATGLYRISGTIPTSGYAAGDACMVRTVATVNGVTSDKLDEIRLDALASGIPAAIMNFAYEGAETVKTLFRALRAVGYGLTTGGFRNFKGLDGTKTRVAVTNSTDRTAVVVDGTD